MIEVEHQCVGAFDENWLVCRLCFVHQEYGIGSVFLQSFLIALDIPSAVCSR